MKNLTRVHCRKYLTMFGTDAIEAQILSEYFGINEPIDTGNEVLDAWIRLVRLTGYFTVGMGTALTTNYFINRAFRDAEELAAFRDKEIEEIKKMQQ